MPYGGSGLGCIIVDTVGCVYVCVCVCVWVPGVVSVVCVCGGFYCTLYS